MGSRITFFPVGNGDMTLISLDDKRKTNILIDINIRASADNDNDEDETFDAAAELKSRLNRNDDGYLYVNVFIQTHPDKDHISGLKNHFHTGKPEDIKDENLILINELWSSPIVWRRADKRTGNGLCDDAKALRDEARRRVALYRETGSIGEEGNRILIIGDDVENKTEGLSQITYLPDDEITTIDAEHSNQVIVRVLGPFAPTDDEEKEEILRKNRSSIILKWFIAGIPGGQKNNEYLMAGDAEVAIWKFFNDKYNEKLDIFNYDVLLTPHHCSWHSLSNDSWSKSANPKVDENALRPLSQANRRAILIASSAPIKNDSNDPPCYGAKEVYEGIASDVSGEFLCTGEYPSEKEPAPIVINFTKGGPQKGPTKANRTRSSSVTASAAPLPHGNSGE